MQRRQGKPRNPNPVFFVDRDLGGIKIPGALRAKGFQVHTMASVYGPHQEMQILDERWIKEGAQKGWVLLSGNKRIRYVPHELQAIKDSDARVFVLWRNDVHVTDQIKALKHNMKAIVRTAQRRPGPYIYKVHESRIELWWP